MEKAEVLKLTQSEKWFFGLGTESKNLVTQQCIFFKMN